MTKRFQKTFAFMLAVIMAMTINIPSGMFGIFDLVKTVNAATPPAATQPENGDGSEGNPFQIYEPSELLWFANHVNSGHTTACAVLKDDLYFFDNIDGKDRDFNFISIGTQDYPFSGTFDGQRHKINVYQSDSSDVAIFGCIGNCTIKKLNVAGSIDTDVKYAAGIAMQNAENTTSKIENCKTSVTINSSVAGDGTHGGIIGVANGTVEMNNCGFSGSIQDSNTTHCGGLIGYTKGAARISNSYVAAKFYVSSTGGNTFSRKASDASLEVYHCYYRDAYGDVPSGATQMTAEQFKSGEVCYKLNYGLSDGTQPWYQTVDISGNNEDVPNILGKRVFYNYINNEYYYGGICPHSNSQDGICMNCGVFEAPTENSKGYYEISKVGHLMWFAQQVNTGKNAINARLMNNIDLSGYTFSSIGIFPNVFNGTFDGAGYTITVGQSGSSDVAIFGHIGDCTIKNLIVEGTIDTDVKCAAGIAMENRKGYTAKIENCISNVTINSSVAGEGTHGGIIGVVNGNTDIINCGFTGAIKGSNTNACGGMVGYTNGKSTISNSYVAADFSGINSTSCDTFSRYANSNAVTLTNCYYLNKLNAVSSGAAQKTEAQFKSGEVCYLLSQGTDGSIWGQDLSTDTLPTIYGVTVYYDSSASPQYYNGSVEKPKYGDGTTNNPYQLTNYRNLVWFQQYVDSGNYTANAVLMADIIANKNLLDDSGEVSPSVIKYKWTPITKNGTAYNETVTVYKGVFDGQGHTISGLYASSSENYCGLFGRAVGTIKNVYITDSYFGGAKPYYVGSIVGYAENRCVVENCGSDATVEGTYYCGGIAGRSGNIIENCYFAGKISGTTKFFNSIVSEYYAATITNCYYLNTCGADSSRAEAMTIEQFKSGEVCYKLNKGVVDGTQSWYQTIGTDDYPQFEGRIVDYNETKYYNHCVGAHKWGTTPTSTVEPTCTEDGYDIYTCTACGYKNKFDNGKKAKGHDYGEDGECKVCGAFSSMQPTNGDGTAANPYQIASYPNLVWFQQQVDSGNASINAVLIDDITANNNLLDENGQVLGTPEYIWTPIAKSASNNPNISYTGVFDGQGHTISGLYAPTDHSALFGIANGTIKNLLITDSYFGTTSDSYSASFIAYGENKSVIENCGSDAVVNANSFGGGIAGFCRGQIKNCYFKGKINVASSVDAISKNSRVTNSYYLDTCGASSNSATAMTESQFESGEVCYRLNGSQSKYNSVWRQNLDVDNAPVLDGKVVYYISAENRYSNVCLEHSYINGICEDCYEYEKPELKDNYYQIKNIGQFYWFTNQVNNGSTSICAKLTADIDFSSNTFTLIGTEDKPFSGTFDGDGHTINVNQSGSNAAAIFGYIGNCTIKNLIVAGTINTDVKFAAGIAMNNVEGTTANIKNCISNVAIISSVNGEGAHGGIIGNVDGAVNITNCAFTGSMKGATTNACGGMVGLTNGNAAITDSYISADFSGIDSTSCDTFSRYANSTAVTLNNCYYLNLLNTVSSGATQMTEAQFKSGEVCYKLNSGVTDGTQAWYQTIGTYDLPMFKGKTVYYNENAIPQYYSDFAITKPEGDGANNPYKIKDYGQLVWFQQHVDAGNYTANAVLIKDIIANENLLTDSKELSGTPKYEWTPIRQSASDSSEYYNGTFDGQGHTISGLYASSNYSALFGKANGTIKNLLITDSYFGSTKITHAGSFAGFGYQCTIENCGSDAVIVATNYAGGIAAYGKSDLIIKNCYFAGKITCNSSYADALGRVGYDPNVINCYYLNTCVKNYTYGTAMTKEQFESGEVAYNLSQGENGSVWGQNLTGENKDLYPVFANDDNYVYRYVAKDCAGAVKDPIVYDYGNENKEYIIDEHIINDWVCSKCDSEIGELEVCKSPVIGYIDDDVVVSASAVSLDVVEGDISYQWYTVVDDVLTAVEGADGREYIVPKTVGTTNYVCVAKIGEHSKQSDVISVTVKAIPLTIEKPVLTKTDKKTISVKVNAKADVIPTYQWYEVVDGNDVAIENAASSSYDIPEGKEMSIYKCKVSFEDYSKFSETISADNIKYTVSVKANDDELGSTEASKTKAYKGEEITVTAEAKNGSKFAGWFDENGAPISDELSYTFKISANISLTAKFKGKYTVSVKTDNEELGSTKASKTEAYEGEEITVTATTKNDSTFLGWYDENGNRVSNELSYNFKISANTSLTAKFKAKAEESETKYTISVKSDNDELGSASTSKADAYADEEVTVTATTKNGSSFLGWFDEKGNMVSNELSYKFKISANISLTAKFKAKYTISVKADNEELGSAAASKAEAYADEEVTVTAETKNGSKFLGWFDESDKAVSDKLSYTFNVSKNISLIAKFKAEASSDDSLKGDVDNNKILTATDATCVLQKVLNSEFKLPIEEVSSDYMQFADVDNNGILTASDAAMILQKVLNNDFVFPIEK